MNRETEALQVSVQGEGLDRARTRRQDAGTCEPWVGNRNQEAAEAWEPEPGTVCVSISEKTWRAKLKPGFDAVLRLQFGDFDPLHVRSMHDYMDFMRVEQAVHLAAFLNEHRGKNMLVHCAAGISRSGAVVEVILEAFPEYEDRGWPRHPNGHVKSLLKRAMGLVPLGAEAEALILPARAPNPRIIFTDPPTPPRTPGAEEPL